MAGRILIIDPVPTNRMVLKAKLALAHYDVSLADSVQQARKLASTHAFEAVLASTALVNHSADCILEWVRGLRGSSGSATTFIFMKDRPNSTSARDVLGQCLNAGADDILNRPFSEDVLLARIRNLMRSHALNRELSLPRDHHNVQYETRTAKALPPINIAIAHVNSDTPSHQADRLLGCLEEAFQRSPRTQSIKTIPLTVLTQPDSSPSEPDVVLLVAGRRDPERALSITSQLRSRARTQDLRVVLIAEDLAHFQIAHAFDLGAHDVVPLNIQTSDLVARLRNQGKIHHVIRSKKHSVRESLLQAITDPLTGLYNRRYAASRLVEMQRDCLDTGKHFAILAFDVDHFKNVNDRYGHAIGDAVLTKLADTLRQNLRDGDLICRTGGEEFLVALPHTDLARATTTANRLRNAVGALDITVKNYATPLRVTVSIGLSLQDGKMPIPEMLDQADRALYQAKARGRNVVAMAAAA
ncbi:diguanylate cyclase [Litoreibacter halocynthiae]|uniref:diguanylate cyclase n=1 Tax=Litoreibacter halocynthiae TaxID=1242689 RepID=UPI0024924EDA|nr:diguanylate cyclase [Litoreibacter halocynthiae]